MEWSKMATLFIDILAYVLDDTACLIKNQNLNLFPYLLAIKNLYQYKCWEPPNDG